MHAVISKMIVGLEPLASDWHDTKKTISAVKNCPPGNFPGDPAVKTLCFHCRGPGLIPG